MSFKAVNKGGVSSFESAGLRKTGLVHAFCTRRNGSSPAPFDSLNFSINEGDREENVRQNWQTLSVAYGIASERFFTLRQVHGENILLLDSLDTAGGNGQLEYDAVLTSRRGVALCIKTADCAPVLLADAGLSAIAAVHAGWKGTSLQIAFKAAVSLMEKFGVRPENILAAVGPAIGPCCYEVDSVVRDAMRGTPGSGLFETCAPGKWKFDLPGANREQLLQAGIPRGNISLSGLCTSCRRDMFYSHRAERQTGRQLNFIMIR